MQAVRGKASALPSSAVINPATSDSSRSFSIQEVPIRRLDRHTVRSSDRQASSLSNSKSRPVRRVSARIKKSSSSQQSRGNEQIKIAKAFLTDPSTCPGNWQAGEDRSRSLQLSNPDQREKWQHSTGPAAVGSSAAHPIDLVRISQGITVASSRNVFSRSRDSLGRSNFAPELQITQVKNVGPVSLPLRQGIVAEMLDGSYLWIQSVHHGPCMLSSIKGYRLVRDRTLGAMLPDKRVNELVWINEVDFDGFQAGLESIVHKELARNVRRIREVTFTNQPWSMLSWEHENGGQVDFESPRLSQIEDHGRLYCRWKYIELQSYAKSNLDRSLRLLNPDEAHDIGRLESKEIRKLWGASRQAQRSHTREVLNVETEEVEQQRQYTMGDCFCGAGGVSRAAIQAGLDLRWAFDKDRSVIWTHRRNFERYGTKSMQINVAEFVQMLEIDRMYADIVHYSPPCQGFSAANRNTNPQLDLINREVLCSIQQMTEKMQPRIATIEETAGLENRHEEWFKLLLNIFTSIGYSVQWGFLDCRNFGVPQTRKRLFVIAAACVSDLYHLSIC